MKRNLFPAFASQQFADLSLEPDINHAEIHGFADASIHAYAAVVYIKVVSSSGHITTTLLVGKSKVVPLKPLIISRLELFAALLLARLIDFVRESSAYKDIPCYFAGQIPLSCSRG